MNKHLISSAKVIGQCHMVNYLSSYVRMPLSTNLIPVSLSLTPVPAATTVDSPLSPSITPSLFHSYSKPTSFINLSHHRLPSLPSGLRTDSTEFMPGPYLLSITVFVFFSFLHCSCCLLVTCGKLSWLPVRFWLHVNIAYRVVSYCPFCPSITPLSLPFLCPALLCPFPLLPYSLFMAALCNRAGHYIWPCGFYLLSFFFFLLLSFFSRLISAAADWMSSILRHLVWP